MTTSSKQQMKQIWGVFISILGVLAIARYVQLQIPLVLSPTAGLPPTEVIPSSYWYVYFVFYIAFAPLIIYYAWKTSKLLDARSTVARLALLALALWVVRFLGNIVAPYSVTSLSAQLEDVFVHSINIGVFAALILLSFRAKRMMVYAAIPIGLVYMFDMLIPGYPTIRLPLPAEFASGLTSLLLFLLSLRALRRTPARQG